MPPREGLSRWRLRSCIEASRPPSRLFVLRTPPCLYLRWPGMPGMKERSIASKRTGDALKRMRLMFCRFLMRLCARYRSGSVRCSDLHMGHRPTTAKGQRDRAPAPYAVLLARRFLCG